MSNISFSNRSPRRAVKAGLIALATGMSLASVASAQEKPAEPFRQIIVQGTAEASAKPDLAITGLGVLRQAPTAGAALKEANKAMADVVDAMKALGIAPRDLQTSGFQISPQYHYDNSQNGNHSPPQLVGYDVRNTLSVRIRNLAAVGTVLDRAIALGVNEGNGVQFTIDDPTRLRDEARRKAVQDARATASLLAEAAGVALGPVISIDVSTDATMFPSAPMARMAAAAPKSEGDAVPVEIGENTVTANVRMVYSIGGGS